MTHVKRIYRFAVVIASLIMVVLLWFVNLSMSTTFTGIMINFQARPRMTLKYPISLEATNNKSYLTIEKEEFGVSNSAQIGHTEPRKILIVFPQCPFWLKPVITNSSLNTCKTSECFISYDATQISKADAVIFHAINLPKRPPKRKLGQPWVFLNFESPANSPLTFQKPEWKNVFNWTITYRVDSDFYAPIAVLAPRKETVSFHDLLITVRNKTKSVGWFASHCATSSKRENYVKRLQGTIDVDIIGQCGQQRRRGNWDRGMEMLNSTYMFYLSFENSLCKDYITEKIFKTYEARVVPVVRGGADYAKLLPPGTYINTADYKTPEDLGAYLQYLITNTTAYMQILRRKEQFKVIEWSRDVKLRNFCDLCKRLRSRAKFKNHYQDINEWFSTGICKQPVDI